MNCRFGVAVSILPGQAFPRARGLGPVSGVRRPLSLATGLAFEGPCDHVQSRIRFGFGNALRIFGESFCRAADAEIENARDHDHRPRVVIILQHGEAKGFGTLDKDRAA